MCITGKIEFRKKEAENALKRNKKSRKKYRKEIRIYICPTCHKWHLTSKEEWEEPVEIDDRYINKWNKFLNNE